jgi:hypothetical protein
MSAMTWGFMTCDKGSGTWALLKKVHVTMTFIRLLVVCTAQRKESIPGLEYFWLPFNRWEGCSDQHSSPWKCVSIRAAEHNFWVLEPAKTLLALVTKQKKGLVLLRGSLQIVCFNFSKHEPIGWTYLEWCLGWCKVGPPFGNAWTMFSTWMQGWGCRACSTVFSSAWKFRCCTCINPEIENSP